jgi:Flp pilus assembly protein TadG
MLKHSHNKRRTRIGCLLAKKMHALASRFINDRRGTIAIIFALTAGIVFAMVGGAVDYGRWLSARSKTLNAMDAAVLAAGRVLQLDPSNTSGALAAAQKYYNENRSNILDQDTVNFSVKDGEIVVSMSSSSVKTPFLGIIGINSLPVNNVSKAILAAGGNAGTHIELALMLDATGSMQGDKLDALKQAATDLVNIVVWQDQSEFTSRVAVVPFSEYVRLDQSSFIAATNFPTTVTQCHTEGGRRHRREVCEEVEQTPSQTCVKERSTSSRYTDDAPGSYYGYFDYYDGSSCSPQATLLPLTSDKDAIKARINAMSASGSTAGHLGTAWAWFALSPNFSNVWPSSNQPLSYSLITELNDSNQPKLHKIAVLMTDGEYNKYYSGSDSATQARELCTKMKAAGVIVYTVGFQLPNYGESRTTLQQCATSSDHFYEASDASALKLAFRDIALKISTLRLAE